MIAGTKIEDRVTIEVDWRSLKSIELAEKNKEQLENDGYVMISTFGATYVDKMVFEKQD